MQENQEPVVGDYVLYRPRLARSDKPNRNVSKRVAVVVGVELLNNDILYSLKVLSPGVLYLETLVRWESDLTGPYPSIEKARQALAMEEL